MFCHCFILHLVLCFPVVVLHLLMYVLILIVVVLYILAAIQCLLVVALSAFVFVLHLLVWFESPCDHFKSLYGHLECL